MNQTELRKLLEEIEEDTFPEEKVKDVKTSLMALSIEDAYKLLKELLDTSTELGQKAAVQDLMQRLSDDTELYDWVAEHSDQEVED